MPVEPSVKTLHKQAEMAILNERKKKGLRTASYFTAKKNQSNIPTTYESHTQKYKTLTIDRKSPPTPPL